MELSKVLFYIIVTVVGTIVTVGCVRLIWLALGAYRIRRAGPRYLLPSRHAIWRDPGDVASLDLVNGPGGSSGAPRPPFHFIEEHSSGSQPCISVQDAAGRTWRGRGGHAGRGERVVAR